MAESLAEQEQLRRDFVANATHELRTPLTNLTGYLEGLRDGVIAPDRATFESLMEETERLVRLSRSLDTLAEGDAGNQPARARRGRPRGGSPIVGGARPADVRAARPLACSGRADRVSWPARAPTTSPRCSAICSRTRCATRPSGGLVMVRATRRGDVAVVTVANTGDGIPATDLPRVFERFYRVEKSRDRAQGGAGIGLAIVRQLVEGAGGQVGVESAEGVTRFWFSLPADRAARPEDPRPGRKSRTDPVAWEEDQAAGSGEESKAKHRRRRSAPLPLTRPQLNRTAPPTQACAA